MRQDREPSCAVVKQALQILNTLLRTHIEARKRACKDYHSWKQRGLHQIPCQDRGRQCKTPYNYYNPDYEKGTPSFWGNPDVLFGSAYDQCNASQEEPKDLLKQPLYDMWKFLKIGTKPPTPSLRRSRNIPSASGPWAEPQRSPIHSSGFRFRCLGFRGLGLGVQGFRA